MMRRHLERALWAAAFLIALVAWVRWRQAVPAAEAVPYALPAAPAPAGNVAAALLAEAGGEVVRTNPFRLDRTPAPIGFQSEPGPAFHEEYRPPPPPRPPLRVTGIVGPPWRALLTGVPDRQGSVLVAAGDQVGDLRVRSVTRETVVVQAPDTTWRLSIQRPWQ
jgi:hypothetical protein